MKAKTSCCGCGKGCGNKRLDNAKATTAAGSSINGQVDNRPNTIPASTPPDLSLKPISVIKYDDGTTDFLIITK